MINKKKFAWIVAMVFLAAFLIRLGGMNQFVYNDESLYVKGITEREVLNVNNHLPPLFYWSNLLVTAVFGIHTWSIRLTSIIYGMLTIWIVYVIARRFFNQKTALWSVALMAFSLWHVIASLQIEADGSALTFFTFLTFYWFMRYDEKKEKKFLWLTGLGLGLSLLSKFPGVLLIPCLGLYYWIRTKSFKKAVIDVSIISIIGLVIFSIYPIISFATNSPSFENVFLHSVDLLKEEGSLNLVLLLVQYLQVLLVCSPLFIGLLLLYFSGKMDFKKEGLFVIYIAVVLFFYTFINDDNFRPIMRYFMGMIPALAILGASYLSKLRFRKKDFVLFFVVLVVSFFAMFAINSCSGELVSFYPKANFIDKALRLEWDFYMPFMGGSSPVGFYVLFEPIAYCFILSGILVFLVLFMRKNKNAAKMLLMCFLAVSLSYNLLLVEEYLVSINSPNISKVIWDVLEYTEKNELVEPVFVFRNFGFTVFYLADEYEELHWLDFDNRFLDVLKGSLDQATIIAVDFPYLDKNTEPWKTFNECEVVKTFEDKGYKIGYVYRC